MNPARGAPMREEIESFTGRQHASTHARRHDRMPVDFAVTLRWPGLRMADRAVDLSEGGLAVETSEPLDAMTLVSLRLELPYLQQPVDVLGRVVWTGPSLMGIRFESSDSRVFDSLHRLRQDIARI